MVFVCTFKTLFNLRKSNIQHNVQFAVSDHTCLLVLMIVFVTADGALCET